MASIEETIRTILREVLNEQTQPIDTQQKQSKLYVISNETDAYKNQLLCLTSRLENAYEVILLDQTHLDLDAISSQDVLVITDLDCSHIAQIALGIAETPLSKVVMNGLFQGQRIFVLHTELDSRVHGNQVYETLFVSYLRRLKEYGIVFGGIEKVVHSLKQKTALIAKVLTLSDVKQLGETEKLIVSRDTVISYSAKEYLKEQQIPIQVESEL